MDWQIKTVILKQCRRCGTNWTSSHEVLEPGDQINLSKVTIAYCPSCSQGYMAEIDNPTYDRIPRKRIK